MTDPIAPLLGFSITLPEGERPARYWRLVHHAKSKTGGVSSPQIPFDAMDKIPFAPITSGLSFQHKISLGTPKTAIGNIGFCIYCGARFHSETSVKPPAEEHIIPEGLGGNLVIEHASCQRCADKINTFEGKLQKTLFHAPRKQLSIRGKSKHTNSHFEVTTVVGGKDVLVRLPLGIHPSVLILPTFRAPKLMSVTSFPTNVAGLAAHSLMKGDPFAAAHLANFASPAVDFFKVCQLLAKIAYSYSMGFMRIDGFNDLNVPIVNGRPSCLVPYILATPSKTDYDTAIHDFVGGIPERLEPSMYLHELGSDIIDISGAKFHVVNIRLFSNLAMPVYRVVVDYVI